MMAQLDSNQVGALQAKRVELTTESIDRRTSPTPDERQQQHSVLQSSSSSCSSCSASSSGLADGVGRLSVGETHEARIERGRETTRNKCNHEHCSSKSFANSSDRIKHHGTCKERSHDGFASRNAKPSSLRRHLRALKMDRFDMVGPSEPGAAVRYSMDPSGLPPQMEQTFARHVPHQVIQQNHLHPQHQQSQHQHMLHHVYPETAQAQQVEISYEHGHHQHHQQDVTYLDADYDPSREFADVLFNQSNASEIALGEATTADETNFYASANFEDSHLVLTNLDEANPRAFRPQAQQPTGQYAAITSAGSAARQHAHRQPQNDLDDDPGLRVCEWRNCGNTFLDINEFVRHLEEKHVNAEPHEKNRYFCWWQNCKRNEQEFNARYKLLIHMRVHSGEKPYSCKSESCKKSFSRLENLKIHVRSHTGDKPYRCNYEHCSKSFTNSSDRIKHHKTHKDPKPYTCTHNGCSKRYTDPSSLRKHLRAHKRDGIASLDSSESAETRNSLANSSFSSQLEQTFVQSSPVSSGQYQTQQHHRYADQGQSSAHYIYESSGSSRQLDAAYGHHKHQQELTYQNVECVESSPQYTNVIFNPSETHDIAMQQTEMPSSNDANYYQTSFDRPPPQKESRLTDLDEFNARSYRAHRQPATSHHTANTGYRQNHTTRLPHQLELDHQLAKSWCGSVSSSTGSSFLQSNVRSGGVNLQRQQQQQQQQQSRVVFRPEQGVLRSPIGSRRVEFEFGSPSQNRQDESWQSDFMPNDKQGSNVHEANFHSSGQGTRYGPPEQQEQHYGTTWSSHGSQMNSLPSENNQQRQTHYRQQMQHQSYLTRRQQHEQLMRSMPASVSYYNTGNESSNN